VRRSWWRRPKPPDLEPGSPAYLRVQAKESKSQRFWAAFLVCYMLLLTAIAEQWYWRLTWSALAAVFAAGWQYHNTRHKFMRQQAWTVETQVVVSDMIRSELYSQEEIQAAINSGPVPPMLEQGRWRLLWCRLFHRKCRAQRRAS